MKQITIYQPEILRRYHLIAFIVMWCLGWLICVVQTMTPIVDAGLDLIGVLIIALVSIPILISLNWLRVTL